VAKTIGSGILHPGLASGKVLWAALAAAIIWNLITWYFGIPSSSSHGLIGGLTGAAIMAFGTDSVNWVKFIQIFSILIASPIVVFIVGATVMTVLFWLFRKYPPSRINNNFRRLQVVSACMMAFSHGSNDAQKSMGIITMALLSAGFLSSFNVPVWVMIICATAMGLGTIFGGWRIIKTMGGKIFRIEPINGFAADFSSSLVIYGASLLGWPVSTTHVVSSSIMGVGAAKRLKGVRWGISRQIVIAWLVTIPSAGILAAIIYRIIAWVLS
jgi:PiT family inorganic phosphate transporter